MESDFWRVCALNPGAAKGMTADIEPFRAVHIVLKFFFYFYLRQISHNPKSNLLKDVKFILVCYVLLCIHKKVMKVSSSYASWVMNP